MVHRVGRTGRYGQRWAGVGCCLLGICMGIRMGIRIVAGDCPVLVAEMYPNHGAQPISATYQVLLIQKDPPSSNAIPRSRLVGCCVWV